MSDLERAKEELTSGGYTCVIRLGDHQAISHDRGVRPLVAWLDSGERFIGYSAADKVIGKATAFLYVLLGVRAVYAHVISKGACAVLQGHGIEVSYQQLVENIINRKGDGICPFEAAVSGCNEPEQAYRIIREQMERMGITI